jgi:hypothetical protein
MLVLKGADTYLSSMLGEYPELRRRVSLVVLVISVILAGVFGIMIVREAASVSRLEAAYQAVQGATVKSFEATSRALESAAAPVERTTNGPDEAAAAANEVTKAMGETGKAMAEDSGE